MLRPIALALALAGLASAASAAELIMLEQPACPWCARWDEEIGVAYPKTEEGRIAPLRRVSIRDPWPADLEGIARERFTPVFVLVSDGKEYGRIRGYPGADFFWPMLGELIARLPPGERGDISQ